MLLKQQTRHGQRLPSLKERGMSVHLAERMMRLRRRQPEILQIAEFDSVQAVLNARNGKTSLALMDCTARQMSGEGGAQAVLSGILNPSSESD